jgi:hypothetical protein
MLARVGDRGVEAMTSRRSVLTGVLSVFVAVAGASPAAARVALTQVSSDPFTNPNSQHRTQVEPDSLSFGRTIVATFQSGRFFNGGASDIGFASSRDGGRTWRHGFLPGTTTFLGGRYDRVSDPSVAFDRRHGVWLISFLGILAAGHPAQPVHVDVLASRSTDGGRTFGKPVPVRIGGPKSSLDKNWTVCDSTPSSPFYGRCYTEFDDNATRPFDLVFMTTSTDGGRTWQQPRPTRGNAHGLGGEPVVQPNGHVVVPILGFPNQNTADIEAFRSVDGGRSWSRPVRVSQLALFVSRAFVRNLPLPSVGIDGAGRVTVVWNDCRFEPGCSANDIVMSSSSDGVSWTPTRRIPIDPVGSGVDHFTPSIAVDPRTAGASARVGLVYYFFPRAQCTTRRCILRVGFVGSSDGGAHWGARQILGERMRLHWFPITNQGYMYGDYTGISVVPGSTAVPVIDLARPPDRLLRAATFAGRLPIGEAAAPGSAPLARAAGGVARPGRGIAVTAR